MSNKWRGILKVLEIQHIRNNSVIWSNKNLLNLIHLQGEEFILRICFSSMVLQDYYFGLDNRATIDSLDTLNDLYQEPSQYGYNRQSVDAENGWTFEEVSGIYRAKSSILTFSASGGPIGPIKNLFMTTQSQSIDPINGYLISSVDLGSSITIADGDSISMRTSVGLSDS
jgi:hypothetical protein